MSSEQQHIAQSNYGASDANTALVPNPAERSAVDAYKSAYEDYTRWINPTVMEGLDISVASPEWTHSLVSGVENGTVLSPLPDGFIGPPGRSTAFDSWLPGWEGYSETYAEAVKGNPLSDVVNGPNCNPCGPRGNGAACASYWIDVLAGHFGAWQGLEAPDTPIPVYDWCE
jgi:hypothetical protein